jgi:hypothetical protein
MINPDEIKSNTNLSNGLNIKPEVLPTKATAPIPLVTEPLVNEPLPMPKFGAEATSYYETLKPYYSELATAEGELKKFEMQNEAEKTKNQYEATKVYKTNVDALNLKAEQKENEYPRPEFHPTKENIASLGSLFSMVSTLGMIVGASGKMGANNAMNAMTGMLKGWQSGRKDLYEKEVKEFDKEYKRITDIRNEIQKKLEKSIALESTNKELAFLEKEGARQLAGSDSVMGKTIAVKGAKAGIDLIINATNLETQYQKLASDAQNRASERALRLQLAQLRSDGRGGAGPKATAKAVDGFRSKLILDEDLNDLRKDLSDPKMVNLIKQYRVEAFFTEESKWLNQAINSNIPNELQEFLTKVRDIRNNYYLDISGKAVTGGEALRSYGTVPQPGDNPEMMVNKINGMQKRVQNQISFDKQFYKFPDIKVSPGERINLIPGQNYSAGATDSEAEQALAWANANENSTDQEQVKKAKAIKKRLGVE